MIKINEVSAVHDTGFPALLEKSLARAKFG
jgi:hypothetical protein